MLKDGGFVSTMINAIYYLLLNLFHYRFCKPHLEAIMLKITPLALEMTVSVVYEFL